VAGAERTAVTIGFDGQIEEVLAKTVTVLNERRRAEIHIQKLWETPENPPADFAPWKEISFGLYAKNDILSADGKVAIPAGALIETIAIDKNGSGKALTDLPFGAYYVQELTTAEGYILDETRHDVLFDGAGEAVTVLSLSATNMMQRGSLRIVKTFEGLDKPMEGVPFLVVGQTVSGEVRFEVKTDKNGEILLEDLPVGSYTVTEQKSDLTASYLLAPAQTVVVTAGRESVLRIVNQLAKGEIRVQKLDAETGKPLHGAMFGLYKDGKLIAEAQSGKDGWAVFKDVAFGEYEVQELSAPVGYNRDDRALKAVVGKDGSVVLLEMTNERIPGEPMQPEEPEVPVTPDMPVPGPEKPPKTGDNRTIVKVAVIVLCLAGIAAGYILLKRKKRDGEETADEDNE
jgi:LPXTG-motif cell wall-anchored protein